MKLKRTLCIFLCLLMIGSLSGCRYSDVLQKIIYNQQKSQEIDEETDIRPEENNMENEQETDDLSDLKTTDEADTQNRQVNENPVSGKENNTTSSSKPVYNPTAPAQGTAVTGRATTVTSTGEGAQAAASSGTGINGTGTGGAGDSGTSFEANPEAETEKEIVDPSGEEVEIPEGIHSIAATGQAALAVLIVGGGDTLAATDSMTVTRAQQTGAFGGLSNTQILWANDGASAMSDDNFNILLEAHPDAVIETSGKGTVTESQAQQLAAAGISYLALPQMTSVDNIEQGISAVAEMLSEGNDQATDNAKQYNDWLSNAYRTITSATSSDASSSTEDGEESTSSSATAYTLYLNGWDASATFSVGNTSVSGTGAAYASNGATESTRGLTNFLGYANVLNTSSKYGIAANTLYVSPILPDFSTLTINGIFGSAYYKGSQKLLEQNGSSLGTPNFPYIIVPDAATKAGVEADRDRGNSLWSIYDHINTGNGSFNSDGFNDASGNIVRTQISGNYEVLINPKGLMSDWTAGGPEGILESFWAGWKYFNAISEDDLRTSIAEFYNNFYDVSLSAGQVDSILAGGTS